MEETMSLISEADVAWARMGALEVGRLWNVVGAEALGIEHVGSTAVAGLRAVEILDLVIGVGKAERIAGVGELLQKAGFAQKRDGEIFEKRGEASLNVFVVEHGGERWNSALLLRDYLRHFPEQAGRFGGGEEGGRGAGGR